MSEPEESRDPRPVVIVSYAVGGMDPVLGWINGPSLGHFAYAGRLVEQAATALETGEDQPEAGPGLDSHGITITREQVAFGVQFGPDGLASGVLIFGAPPTATHLAAAALTLDEYARHRCRRALEQGDEAERRTRQARQRLGGPPMRA